MRRAFEQHQPFWRMGELVELAPTVITAASALAAGWKAQPIGPRSDGSVSGTYDRATAS